MSECGCFDRVMQKVTENLKGQLEDRESATFRAEWENAAFILGDGEMTTKVGIPVAYEYQRFKKNGDPHKNSTKDSIKIMMSYCPFCGKSLKKESDQ